MTSKSLKLNGKAREAGKACLVFSVLFALMTAALLWYFHHSGRTFVWMSDAYRQHLRAMIYYSRWFRSLFENIFKGDFTIPAFSFSLGYGGDILTTFHHYGLGEPLCFLSVLVPEDGMVWFYTALIFIRMYLAGLAFIAFYLYRRGRSSFGAASYEREPVSPFLAASGALTYVFAAYPVHFCMQHPHFLAAFIYFPLLLLGIERAAAERKPAILILTVFLTTVSSFYFLYMTAILAVIWYLIRRLPLGKDFGVKRFVLEALRLLLYGITGVLLAGAVFLPVIASFLQDARSVEHSAFTLFYQPEYYRNILQSTVSSDAINRNWYSALGFGGVFVACFSMLLLRLRKNIRLFLMIILMTLGLMIPFFGYFMNGFGYVVNRWLFAFCLAAGVLVASMLEEFRKASLREVLITFVISLLYAGLAVLIRSSATVTYLRQLVFLGAFFVLTILAVLAVPKLPEKIRKRNLVAAAFSLFSAGIILASLLYNDYRYLKTTVKRPISVFVSPDGSREGTLFWDNDARLVSETGDSGLFRYVTDDPEQRYENTSLLYDLSTTQYYWSISNPGISRFMTELCVSDPVNLYEWYHGMDDRSELLLLSGVRYYLRKGEGLIPYSYEEAATGDNSFTGLSLYRTDLALPFAWTYDQTISEEALLSLPPILRQEALLQAAAVRGVPSDTLPEQLKEAENVRPLALSFSKEEGLTHSDHTADAAKKKASLTLKLESSETCESYLYVTGLQFSGRNPDPGNDSWTEPTSVVLRIRFLSGDTVVSEKKLNYRTSYDKWGKDQSDFIVNSGYHEGPVDGAEIIFPEPGLYEMDSLSAYAVDLSKVPGLIAERTSDEIGVPDLHDASMKNVTGRIDYTIRLKDARTVVMQVPYSDGWEAFVDGEKAEIFRVNLMFSGLMLPEGAHEISLRYHTPFLRTGLLVSLAGAALLIFLLVYEKRKRKESI